MGKTYIKQYIENYKDIKLTSSNFNEVDAAILSTLCLIDVSSSIPFEKSNKTITFKKVLEIQINKHGLSKLGLLLPISLTKTLLQASLTKRFGNLLLHDLHKNVSEKLLTQSTFFTIDLDKDTKIIIFGSTDDTVVGWLENINLLRNEEPTCNKEAIQYLNKSFNKKYKYFLVGHSKGGFECAYTYFKTSDEIRKNIIKAYDFDGPGFSSKSTNNFNVIPDNFEFICPKSSYVGRMFNQPIKPKIVKAKFHGLLQHNPNTWRVKNNHFVTTNKFSKLSSVNINAINKYLGTLNKIDKDILINATKKILLSSNDKTLTDLAKHPLKVLKQSHKLTKQEKIKFRNARRSIFVNQIKELFKSTKN